MTEGTGLIKAGEHTAIRFKKELAEQINSFAAIRHIENKTEAVHAFCFHLLEGKTIPKTEVVVVKMANCQAFKKDITYQHCENLQSVKGFRDKSCQGCINLKNWGV